MQELHMDSAPKNVGHTQTTNGTASGNGNVMNTVSCISSSSKLPVPPGVHSEEDTGANRGADGATDGQRRGQVACALGSFQKEVAYLAHLGWPVVLTQCLHYTIGMVAIMFAGHRGNAELDVVALSVSILSATAISVANGFSGYCDTIFAQVYGSSERETLGTVLQKCLLIMTLCICPCLAVHVNIRPILLYMGYNHTVVRLSEQYLLIHIPGTVAAFFYVVLSKYVQNQNREVPILVVALSANVLNAVIHAIFFVWLEAGVWCSALSQSLSYVSLMVLTIIYIVISGIYKETWQGWTSECFWSWGLYCKLGVYSMLQTCIEFWAFESAVILSGTLSLQMIAAQSILFQLVLILYTIAWGIGMTAGIRIGQHLGANDPKAAQLSSRVTLMAAGLIGFIFFILVISLRYQLPRLFTDDRETIELAASVLPIVAVVEIFDYLGASMNGILRGCGRQAIGTYISVPAFSTVIIVGLTLMLKTSLMIKGFWITGMCALAFQALVGTIFVIRLNWQDEAENAQTRVGINEVVKPLEIKTSRTPLLTTRTLTKKIVLLRLLAFGASIGCLLISLIVRFVIDIPIETHSSRNSSVEAERCEGCHTS